MRRTWAAVAVLTLCACGSSTVDNAGAADATSATTDEPVVSEPATTEQDQSRADFDALMTSLDIAPDDAERTARAVCTLIEVNEGDVQKALAQSAVAFALNKTIDAGHAAAMILAGVPVFCPQYEDELRAVLDANA